jgi:hypothetical protein
MGVPVLALIIAVAIPSAASIAGRTEWKAHHDGPVHGDDTAFTEAMSPDGSAVFLTGPSDGSNGTDYATVAYDTANGAQLWAARYDGPGHSDDEADMVAVSPDGSTVFVTGWSTGADTGQDLATVAYDSSSGHRRWVKRYDGAAHLDDFALSLAASPDGSLVIADGGTATSPGVNDYVTVAYDTVDGSQRWVKLYDGSAHGDDWSNSVGIGPDGTVYATGQSVSTNHSYDIATVAYRASDGMRMWAARYDGPAHGYDYTCLWTCVEASPDGSVVYIFGQEFGGTSQDAVLLSYDAASGTKNWAAEWDGPSHLREDAADLAVTPDGSTVLITGYTITAGPRHDLFVAGFDALSGTKQWDTTYDGSTGDDGSNTIVATPDSTTAVITGYSNNDGGFTPAGRDAITIAYRTSNGHQKWLARYDGKAGGQDDGSFVVLSPDGTRAYIAGDTFTDGGQLDFLAIAYRVV